MAQGTMTHGGASHQLPPLAHFGAAGLGSIFWFAGTAVQLLTSEAWMRHISVWNSFQPLLPYAQIWDFINGHLAAGILVPFIFAWSVQLATVFASIGVELPPEPVWRFWGFVALLVALIGVNSCGDYQSSSEFGVWGQLGFTVAVLFLTFCVGLFVMSELVKGVRMYRSGAALI